MTGGAAWAIDSGTGADNKYDSVVNVSLAPKGLAAAAEAAAKAPAPAAVGAEPEAPAVAPPQAQ